MTKFDPNSGIHSRYDKLCPHCDRPYEAHARRCYQCQYNEETKRVERCKRYRNHSGPCRYTKEELLNASLRNLKQYQRVVH